MFKFVGANDKLAFFEKNGSYAAINVDTNTVVDFNEYELLSELEKLPETPSRKAFSDATVELAMAALTSLDPIVASGDRMYTIPDGVISEAKKALEWRKEYKRGGTPVGLNTARTLAEGGQIGIRKVRHIAKYFPRHEVDKKGKGWDVGEDGYPSNGKIAWALWGGDAAWRWSRAIVERENRKAKTAGGYAMAGYEEDFDTYGYEEGYSSDLSAFKMARDDKDSVGPEFMVRVRLDGAGIDRLYKIDVDGKISVWDDCGWDDLGQEGGDVYSYDEALSAGAEEYGSDHVLIDAASAVVVSAFLQERPFQPVRVEEIDPEEAALVAEGLSSEDFAMIDRVMTAAGESPAPGKPSKADKDGDGKLDSDFLSQKAKNQVRDAAGLFAKTGSRVVVAGDEARGSGVISKINTETGMVDVELDSGNTISVDAKFTRAEPQVTTGPRRVPNVQAPLDTSGILGEPRTPMNMPKAQLPGTLPPITNEDLQKMLNDWDSWVAEQRTAYKPLDAADKTRVQEKYGKDVSSKFSITAAAKPEELTPETSDVGPKYLAIVSPDDKAAVMDLIALVPATKDTTTLVVYERIEGKWQKNEQILRDLKSSTPPPVVPLTDKEVLNDVLTQVDETSLAASAYDFSVFWESVVEPILAAGGLDRNRGGAEKLRRYWTRGKGALKIRWGTPGDWTRCVRQLSKYMGPRAKGYCQLRHKEATGVYTGSKYNAGKKKGRRASGSLFATLGDFETAMLSRGELNAKASDAREKVGLVAAAPRAASGAKFYIPTIVPEELESGDGRKFKKGSISVRDLPVPLLWQIKTGSGHDGSVVVGRIDYIERIEGGMGNAYGVFDTGPYGREAERLVRHGFLRGVSVDLDQFEAKEDKKPKKEMSDDDGEGEAIGKDKLTINKARIMAATIVAKPAFQECSISIEESGDQEDNMTPEDGVYEESMQDFTDVEPILASGFLRQEIPLTPPADWFVKPQLSRPTPLTVTDDGRVYGHIAAWNVNHIGLPRATKPPRSKSNYAYFHTGVIRTADGNDVAIGQLTLAGGHAPLNVDAASAAKHYDDTASAVADIHVGEDEYGIWCAGSLRPNLEEMQIRALRASAPSGDWRPINGSLELVAICQVNVPGFPTARAMVAGGKMLALVAAGASYMAMMKCSGPACALSTKAELLGQLAAGTPDLKVRVREAKKTLRNSNLEALTASASAMREKALVAAAVAELAKISEDERMDLAKKGHAMPDGAYPIRDVDDLKNAIQAYGRARASERREVRKHIMKRARALKQWPLVPEQWKNASSLEAAERVASMRAAITAAAYGESVVAAGPKGEEISDSELEELRRAKEEADKQTEEEIDQAEKVRTGKTTAEDKFDEDGRQKYVSGVTQPRDAKGKYRTVLARLKQDLGVAGLSKALLKVQDAENLDFSGDYAASAVASDELLGMLDRLDSKALNPEALENVKNSAAALGTVISNLPLPFGKDATKVRYSDLPAGLKNLIEDMMTRVEAKIGKEDANVVTEKLRAFKAGADVMNQGEVQSEMATMLRLLT